MICISSASIEFIKVISVLCLLASNSSNILLSVKSACNSNLISARITSSVPKREGEICSDRASDQEGARSRGCGNREGMSDLTLSWGRRRDWCVVPSSWEGLNWHIKWLSWRSNGATRARGVRVPVQAGTVTPSRRGGSEGGLSPTRRCKNGPKGGGRGTITRVHDHTNSTSLPKKGPMGASGCNTGLSDRCMCP